MPRKRRSWAILERRFKPLSPWIFPCFAFSTGRPGLEESKSSRALVSNLSEEEAYGSGNVAL
jgi:hypothetical protein